MSWRSTSSVKEGSDPCAGEGLSWIGGHGLPSRNRIRQGQADGKGLCDQVDPEERGTPVQDLATTDGQHRVLQTMWPG